MISETQNKKMPVLFIGHGNPMNAIEDNYYTRKWKEIALQIPKPEAIFVISSNWVTDGTGLTAIAFPPTIHDLEEGFDEELFNIQYPAPGSPQLARKIKDKVKNTYISLVEQGWGIDHATWVVLKQMYPNANIPIVQLGINFNKNALSHYELGQELAYLRDEGVLILGTGNVVHNYTKGDFHAPNSAYTWARNFDEFVKKMILEDNHEALIKYQDFGEDAMLSIPTPEHYYPLLYVLAAKDKNDKISFPVEDIIFGSLSMRCVLFQS